MSKSEASELDALVVWAKKCGHFSLPPLVENFRRYQASLREREKEALRERAKDE